MTMEHDPHLHAALEALRQYWPVKWQFDAVATALRSHLRAYLTHHPQPEAQLAWMQEQPLMSIGIIIPEEILAELAAEFTPVPKH
jgi:hypothetical protein